MSQPSSATTVRPGRWRRPPPPHLATVPLLRGRLHQAGVLVWGVAGTLLVVTAPGGAPRAAAAIYALASMAMFVASSVYHRRAWTPAGRARMRRVDHSMILVLIAGSATPQAMLVLHPPTGVVVLAALWGVTAAAVGLRVLWRSCPRWLIHPMALAIGCGALVAVPRLVSAGEVASLVLLAVGVGVYLFGMTVLVRKRPDPAPAVFGYHELFHALTLVAGVLVFVLNARVIAAG